MARRVWAEQDSTGDRMFFDADVFYQNYDGMGWRVLIEI